MGHLAISIERPSAPMDGRVNRSRYKGKANVENELQAFVRLSADPHVSKHPFNLPRMQWMAWLP